MEERIKNLETLKEWEMEDLEKETSELIKAVQGAESIKDPMRRALRLAEIFRGVERGAIKEGIEKIRKINYALNILKSI